MNASNQEALSRATQSASTSNYGAIFAGFAAKGIEDIKPRENVFTFNAWRELGRQVKRGEHGVSVSTWIPMTKKDESGTAQPIGRKPRTTTVFHISQTEPIKGYSDGLWLYALKQERAGAEKPEFVSKCAPEVSAELTGYYSDEFTAIK